MTASYKAQVLEINQRVWELGWMAALKEAGVSEDHPIYKNPSKFPSSDLGSSSAPGPSSEADVVQVKNDADTRAVQAEVDAVQSELDANAEAAA